MISANHYFLFTVYAQGNHDDLFQDRFNKLVNFIGSDLFKDFLNHSTKRGIKVVPRFSADVSRSYDLSFKWSIDLYIERTGKSVLAKQDANYIKLKNVALNLIYLLNYTEDEHARRINESPSNLVSISNPNSDVWVNFSLYQMKYRERVEMTSDVHERPTPSEFYLKNNLLGQKRTPNRFIKQVRSNGLEQYHALNALKHFVDLVNKAKVVPSPYSESDLDLKLDLMFNSSNKFDLVFSTMTPLYFFCITSVDFESELFKEVINPYVTYLSFKNHDFKLEQLNEYDSHMFCFGVDVIKHKPYERFIDFDPDDVELIMGPFNVDQESMGTDHKNIGS